MDEYRRIFKRFYIFGKILGFCPFFLNKNGEIRTSIPNTIYSLFVIFGGGFFVNNSKEVFFEIFNKGASTWSQIGLNALTYFTLLFTFVLSIGNLINRKTIENALRLSQKLDRRIISNFGHKIDYKFQLKLSRILVTSTAIYFFC
jgi:hypothetical protein